MKNEISKENPSFVKDFLIPYIRKMAQKYRDEEDCESKNEDYRICHILWESLNSYFESSEKTV